MKTNVNGKDIEYDGTPEGLKKVVDDLRKQNQNQYLIKFNLIENDAPRLITPKILGVKVDLFSHLTSNIGIILDSSDILVNSEGEVTLNKVTISSDDIEVNSDDEHHVINFDKYELNKVNFKFLINYNDNEVEVIEKEYEVNKD